MLSRAISPSILTAQRKPTSVKLKFFAPALLCCTIAAVPATAQIYTDEDVTVNPSAAGSGVQLYPGGKYGRVTQQLMRPGEPAPKGPIHLHMPVHHFVWHVEDVASAKNKTEGTAAANELLFFVFFFFFHL